MAAWGAFAFGFVLGWFAYFSNRYRKGEIQLGDLATLVGIIGGGAITALFGDAKTTLFGAYGVGLAVGFFAYFVTLLILVKKSGGVFTVTWFLDGRRKKLAEDEWIPGETRETIAPMAPMPSGLQRAPALELAAPSPLARATESRDRVIAALTDSSRELIRRIGDTADATKRAQLIEAQAQISQKFDELVALRLRDILDSDSVRSALAKLDAATSELTSAAQEMKTAANTIAAAAKTVDRATKVIGFFSAIFA